MGGFFVADYFPHMWWLDVVTGVHQRLRRNFLEYDSLYERIIEDHLDPKRLKPEEEDFLDNLILGASDTSAATVSWGMLELMRNP
ncbi:cytochrome P450 83B1-like protein [Cinnamomum micranthum f. kanehirae]|uniref:Cytochrome P450 83B1-like protein n=1 Tax=Cinnamomum micranthum f. kanehirae TaxID=337451 RepID=A0A443N3V5_9MAGN|nr:cytochrome P450 83B1-like protein [Cinnamomum micranthum f. kanehirae]